MAVGRLVQTQRKTFEVRAILELIVCMSLHCRLREIPQRQGMSSGYIGVGSYTMTDLLQLLFSEHLRKEGFATLH